MLTACLAAYPLIFVTVAAAKVLEVTVGGAPPNQISFQPSNVSAEPGDIVRFFFKQKNHTVTQTSFMDVCNPLLDEYTHQPVLDTGFMPVAPEKIDNFPYFDLPVLYKDPSWFYCRQTRHCGQGMIFAVNAPLEGEKTFENFQKKALEFGAKEVQSSTQSSLVAPTATQAYTTANTMTATYSSETILPAPVPTESEGAVHRVIVGSNGTLTFYPQFVAAKPQDTILFEFQTKNHTATQSSFGAPCRKLEFTSDQKGFDSGFMPVANGTSALPTFNVTVKDGEPIWVYCRQDKHCGQGMVFAVNPPSEQKFTEFVALAKSINGTSSNPSPSQSTSNGSSSGAIPTVRASMAFATFLVGGLFVLTF